MTLETFNTVTELRRLIDEGHVSEAALQAITGASLDSLRSFLSDPESAPNGLTAAPQVLTSEESASVSILVAYLSKGFEVGDDERLVAILDVLTQQFAFTLENLALLIRARREDLEELYRAPESVSTEVKYPIGLRLSYLSSAIGNSRLHELGRRHS